MTRHKIRTTCLIFPIFLPKHPWPIAAKILAKDSVNPVSYKMGPPWIRLFYPQMLSLIVILGIWRPSQHIRLVVGLIILIIDNFPYPLVSVSVQRCHPLTCLTYLELILGNLWRVLMTSITISSVPVHQLTHVGNRLSVLLLWPSFCVLTFISLCNSSPVKLLLHFTAVLTIQMLVKLLLDSHHRTPCSVSLDGYLHHIFLPAFLPPTFKGNSGIQVIHLDIQVLIPLTGTGRREMGQRGILWLERHLITSLQNKTNVF